MKLMNPRMSLGYRINIMEEQLSMQRRLLCVGGSRDCHASLPHSPSKVENKVNSTGSGTEGRSRDWSKRHSCFAIRSYPPNNGAEYKSRD